MENTKNKKSKRTVSVLDAPKLILQIDEEINKKMKTRFLEFAKKHDIVKKISNFDIITLGVATAALTLSIISLF